MIDVFPQFDGFIRFIVERHRIYERRVEGQPAPWTKDPILRAYRFCNVYRELDRVTQWIAQHWRAPHATHDDLWFAMVVARLVNKIETLETISFPRQWNKRQFIERMHARRATGEAAFGAAYIVSTGGMRMDKAVYLATYVLDPMWKNRRQMRPKIGETLESYHTRLRTQNGLGSFMAAQIVADMKYVYPLSEAKDWWRFASSGPGSKRGLSYVMGLNPREKKWKESDWRDTLLTLAVRSREPIREAGLKRIHAQDLQNCLCEFSKYRRTQLGTGRPKQKFIPHEEQ